MPTSNSFDWTLNRGAVIKGALRKLGVLADGASPSASQTADAAEALNALVKAFHADGMPLWAITRHIFLVTASTSTYNIGVGQTLDTPTPLKVLQAFYIVNGGENVPMNVYNRYDFNILPQINPTGVPISLYYQQLTDNLGTIKLWPTPTSTDTTTQIVIEYQRQFSDMDTDSDDFDFPNYWIQALIYNLAWAMSPEFGMPVQDRQLLASEAKYWKEEALSYGSEEGSIRFQPKVQ